MTTRKSRPAKSKAPAKSKKAVAKRTARKRPAAKRAMPSFTKAPAEVVASFDAALAAAGAHERRTMFGYPAAFANTQMFACVFQDRIMLRLAPADRERALTLPGARLFEPMPGRPMREYVDLPASVRADAKLLGDWFRLGRAYATSLPPKRKR